MYCVFILGLNVASARYQTWLLLNYTYVGLIDHNKKGTVFYIGTKQKSRDLMVSIM